MGRIVLFRCNNKCSTRFFFFLKKKRKEKKGEKVAKIALPAIFFLKASVSLLNIFLNSLQFSLPPSPVNSLVQFLTGVQLLSSQVGPTPHHPTGYHRIATFSASQALPLLGVLPSYQGLTVFPLCPTSSSSLI